MTGIGGLNKDFLIRVKADLGDVLTKLDRLQQEFDQTNTGGRKAADGVSATDRAVGFLKRTVVAYLSLATAKRIIDEADAYNVLQDRIRTATKEFGDYNTVSKELFAQSQRNGTALESNVQLFQRLARAAPELKATQEQVLAVTNAVQQLGVISGASNEQMRFGLTQLAQAFSSDVFRAEELNSVLENTPEIANRIAKGLGVSVGEMRRLVIEGKLASKDAFEAILKQTEEISDEFADIPQRVGRATQRATNSIIQSLAVLDNKLQGTSSLANFLTRLSVGLDRLNRDLTKGQGNPFASWSLDQVTAELEKVNAQVDDVRQRASRAASIYNRVPEGIANERRELLKTQSQLLEVQEKLNAAAAASGGGKTTLTDEQIKAQEQIRKTIEALELEAATLGKTKTEIALYKLQLLGASDAQLQLARASLEAIDAQEKAAEQQKEVQRIFEETRTPLEKLNAELKRLVELYEAGAFGAVGTKEAMDTLGRATDQAVGNFEELQKKGDETFSSLEAAVRGWGNAFTDTLADMVLTGKGEFKDLADAIIRDILRIAIQRAITQPLINAGLNAIGVAPVGQAHSGGIAGSLSVNRSVSPHVFAGAPRYHAGGFAGLSSNEVPAILQRGEEVLTRNDPRHAANLGAGSGGGINLTVEVQNQGTPQSAKNVTGRFQGDEFVVSIVTQDIVNDGSISQTLKRTFNIPRTVR